MTAHQIEDLFPCYISPLTFGQNLVGLSIFMSLISNIFRWKKPQNSIFKQQKASICICGSVSLLAMLINSQKKAQFLNGLKFQQYFPLQQYYQSHIMSDSCFQELSESSQTISRSGAGERSLNKFKPWVFRPKKVIYSLDDNLPTKKQYSTSHWTEQQNRKYIDFLLKFRQVIEGEKKQRRKWHLNRIMSKFLGTRSHEQCRSHHQKMIKNYHSIDGIIQHFNRNAESAMVSDPSTSPTAPFLNDDPLPNLKEDDLFNLLGNPFDQDSEYIRTPFFSREQSNDMF